MNKIKNIEVDLTGSEKFKQYSEAQAEREHQESESAYVSYKERHDKSTKYLDEKRKSFPIRKGRECTDLAAAVHAWGRYKGEMSHDTFMSKVKRLMKEHSYPLPESWKDNKS